MFNFKIPLPRFPRNPRTLFAVALIALSFLAALAIAGEAAGTSEVWAASRELTTGHTIVATDLTATKVLLPSNSAQYFSQTAKLIGYVVARPISASELIARSALSHQRSQLSLRSLPVKVARGDMPIDLGVGEKVDIYSIPTASNPKPFDPILAAIHVSVESIDQKSKDLGGEIGIVLSVSSTQVLPIINDIENSRVLVVRNAL